MPTQLASDKWQYINLPVGDGDLLLSHFPANNPVKATPVIVFHGNGMNGWSCRKLIEPKLGKNPVYLIDIRGHGKSTAKADPYSKDVDKNCWALMHADALKVYDFIVDKHGQIPHVVGHSLGALLSIELLNKSKSFASMTLVEPVLLDHLQVFAVHLSRLVPYLSRFNSLKYNAERRRDSWSSFEDVKESYLQKSFFKRFDDQVFEDYLAHGLKFDGDQVRLSCTPAWEAQIFHYVDTKVIGRTKRDNQNVRFIVGDAKNSTVTPTGIKQIQRRFPKADILTLRGHGHFIPFHVPHLVSEALAF